MCRTKQRTKENLTVYNRPRELNTFWPPYRFLCFSGVSRMPICGLKCSRFLACKGLSYTTMNTARSALSAVILPSDNVSIGSHPVVSRFMKGIYKLELPTCTKIPHYAGCNSSPFLLLIIFSKSKRIKFEIPDSQTDYVNCTGLCSTRTEPTYARYTVHERRGHLF